MVDHLSDLDKGGNTCQFVKTWMGPTLGWLMLPVDPEIIVASASALTISPYNSRVLLNAAVKAIALPSVTSWVLAQTALANIAAFDRSLWIKDLIGQASPGAPIILTPNGTDKIDTLSTWRIITAGELVRLYPMTDLSGWYVG